jgi:hypothetical protein
MGLKLWLSRWFTAEITKEVQDLRHQVEALEIAAPLAIDSGQYLLISAGSPAVGYAQVYTSDQPRPPLTIVDSTAKTPEVSAIIIELRKILLLNQTFFRPRAGYKLITLYTVTLRREKLEKELAELGREGEILLSQIEFADGYSYPQLRKKFNWAIGEYLNVNSNRSNRSGQ